MFKILVMATAIILLAACAKEPLKMSESAEKDYLKGQSLINSVEYARAVQFLEKFSAKYPYSKYASKAEVLRIEAAFLDEQYILSETLSLRFLDAHPIHNKRARVQYLLAKSFYEESSSAAHEQKFSNKARDAFVALNKDFPQHPNRKETNGFIQLLTDRIAKHELLIGEYYYDKMLYVAAANRFIVIKNNFPDANILDQALYYLAASYTALEKKSYAQKIIVLLDENFPQSDWRDKAKKLM